MERLLKEDCLIVLKVRSSAYSRVTFTLISIIVNIIKKTSRVNILNKGKVYYRQTRKYLGIFIGSDPLQKIIPSPKRIIIVKYLDKLVKAKVLGPNRNRQYYIKYLLENIIFYTYYSNFQNQKNIAKEI